MSDDTKVKYKTLFSLAQDENVLSYNYRISEYNKNDIPATPNTRNYSSGESDTLFDIKDWGGEGTTWKSISFTITVPNPYYSQTDYKPSVNIVWNDN